MRGSRGVGRCKSSALAYHLNMTWKVLNVESGGEDEQIERHLGILKFSRRLL